MEVINKKPFCGEASIDVQQLVNRMKQMAPEELVTYKELTQLIGRDVTVHRHLTDSARKILMRDHNMVFRSVINEGLKRLADCDVVDVVLDDRRKRIYRQAAVASRELTTVDYARLGSDKQTRHNTGMALFGALYQATSKTAVKRLQQRVANAGGAIDNSGILRLIGWLSD